MKTFVTLFIIILIYNSSFPQNLYRNYTNTQLNVPAWLTEKDYIAGHQTADTKIEIQEEAFFEYENYKIVTVALNEIKEVHTLTTLYLASFDQSGKLTDLFNLGMYFSKIGTWNTEHYLTKTMSYGVIDRRTIEPSFRKPENNEEWDAYPDGLVPEKTDTLQQFIKVQPNGKFTLTDSPYEK